MIITIKKENSVKLESCCNHCNNEAVITLEDLQGVETLKWWGFQNLWWQPDATGFEDELMIIHCDNQKAIVEIRRVFH